MATGRWVDFVNLIREQQGEAMRLRPKWKHPQFLRMQFWVKPDGHVSKRKGHHQLTKAAGAAVDAMIEGRDVPTSKISLDHFKVGSFSMNREK